MVPDKKLDLQQGKKRNTHAVQSTQYTWIYKYKTQQHTKTVKTQKTIKFLYFIFIVLSDQQSQTLIYLFCSDIKQRKVGNPHI